VRSWRKRKEKKKSKFWAISLSLVWICLGDHNFSCLVKAVVAAICWVKVLLLQGQNSGSKMLGEDAD